ncbi:MAG TPA: trypsin-like serine protease [Planctomycetaceae bacterium]|nr:trypsin-like serine protease [Planctomycetaceae bacterium]
MRFGNRWVKRAVVSAAREEERHLLDIALQLLKRGDEKQARLTLKKASRVNPEGIRAELLLGLLLVSSDRDDLSESAAHFRKALKRAPDNVAVLNNLAISEVKLHRWDSAVKRWKRGLQLDPAAYVIRHNVWRCIWLHRRGRVRVPADAASQLRGLAGRCEPETPRESLNRGWLYCFSSAPRESDGSDRTRGGPGDSDGLILAGTGTGFVVAKHYVLTNRHVVRHEQLGLADMVRIVDPAETSRVRELECRIAAVSEHDDLALLHCEPLKAPPLPLAETVPPRQTEVIVLGYPMEDVLGRQIKSTRGVIVSLPNPSSADLVLFDASLNPGNSGSPVCDRTGRVVAVATLLYQLPSKLSAGIPAPAALAFVKEHLEDYGGDAPQPGEEKSLVDVDAQASRSTVMVRVYYHHPSRPARPSGAAVAAEGWYVADRTCIGCNGAGTTDCPVCLRGKIKVKKPVVIAVDPRTGEPVVQQRFFQRLCSNCNGTGNRPCLVCRGSGIEPPL